MYKVGDKVRVINTIANDASHGIEIGDIYTVDSIPTFAQGVSIRTRLSTEYLMYSSQIESVQLSPPTQFNFITKAQITEHLQNVITFYEDYTSDLLKETARDYKEDIIDLKETGYEFRLELDKILIQVEEELV